MPPLSQYRATGSSSAPLSTNIVAATGPYPASFFAASGPLVAPVANAGAGGFAPNPTAFLFPQLQLATPVATAQGKDFKPSKTTGVAGVVDPGQTDPFWAPYPVTGYLLPGTYGPSDAAALLGSFYNVSGSANSTSGWFGYNFTTAAYPDPLYSAIEGGREGRGGVIRGRSRGVPHPHPHPLTRTQTRRCCGRSMGACRA